MKTVCSLLLFLVLASSAARADEPAFPGLKAIMGEANWKRAKLDRLDPEDVRLIDESLAQYLKGSATQPGGPAAGSVAAAPSVTAASPAPVSAAEAPPPADSSQWAMFGLPAPVDKTRAEHLVMHATATAWHGANGFELDNGQVWQGIDPIREELVGHDVGIEAGKLGAFLLLVDGQETNVRVHRVK